MSSKDIVGELMNEWEAAKMDTPHGLPAFKKAADEITRLRELLARCVPWMLILEDAGESKEAEFWKLIDEVKGYE